ncbi:MAG: hypothetical protein IPJ77_10230 [Planctomycetes bacterium]|nr:hypothetical protein [Planctomycetota bacterium]
MDARATESGAWTRLELVLLAAFVVIAGASTLWLVHPWYERANDASIYLLTARSLAHGEGYSYLGEPFTVRPPGFSALLAPFLGGDAIDFRALNLYVSAFGVAGLALFFAWIRTRLGAALAFALCLAIWFNPAWQHLCNMVLSDVPGTALLFLCLVLERRFERSTRTRALETGARPPASELGARATLLRDVLLGLAIGLASLVRTMNVLLAPAIVIERACALWRDGRRGKELLAALARRALPLAIGAALALEPWSLWSAAHRPDGAVDQLYVHSYSTAMWHTDIGDPHSPLRPLSDVAARVPDRAEKLVALLGSRMQAPETGGVELLLGALVLAGVLVVLWRRRAASEWFVFGAAAMLLVFASFLDRHALPVWILACGAALEGLLLVLERLRAPRALAQAIAIALVASVAWVDWAPRHKWDVVEESHLQMERYCAAAAKELAPDARPAAMLGWHYSVYLGRPVWSLMFVQQRQGVGALPALLERERIDTVLLSELMPTRPDVEAALAPRVLRSVDVELGRVLHLE